MNFGSRRLQAAAAMVGAAVVGVLVPVAPAAAAGPAKGAEVPRIELVLDLSGSMKQNDAGGQTRLAAAKKAVTRIIDSAPEQAALGLRVYGATYPGEDKAQGCADTQQVLPVGTMDTAARDAARKRVAGFDAVGFTPIGASLRKAAEDLGGSGARRIVLVSDGEDTCAPPPPCEVARELKAQGIDLAMDVVGFKTDGDTRNQLKCIADATGGSYVDAGDADSLAEGLGELFRKAWRLYEPSGTPVKGTHDSCTNAPLIAPGQYLDAFPGGQNLFYRVKKRPDQQLQVSATAIAEEGYPRGSMITVAAGLPGSGEPKEWLRAFEQSMGWANVITAGARSLDDAEGRKPAPDDTGCIMITNKVTKATDKPMPVELLVGIADASTARAAEQVPEPRTGSAAEGGFSFNGATPIGPGTYRQSIAVGEAPFWRVEVKPGQRLKVTGGVEIPQGFPSATPTGLSVAVYNAMREAALCNTDHNSTKLFGRDTGRFERVCGPWDITERGNATNGDINGYDVPGTYYIQLQVAEPAEKAKGIVVPVDLTVEVTGTALPVRGPAFVFREVADSDQPKPGTGGAAGSGARPDDGLAPAGTAKDKDDSTLEKLALPTGIGAAAVILAGAVFFGLRRRGPA